MCLERGVLESRSADVTDNNSTPNIPGTMIDFNVTVPTIARERNITSQVDAFTIRKSARNIG